MRVLSRALGAVCALAAGLLVTGCGTAQQAPKFEQAFGAIDSPCGINAAVSDAIQHCTAHVLLVNKGGEGLGHATMVVELKDPKAGASGAATIKCGRSIPDLPGGGYTDLVCAFDVPPGKVIGTVPSLQAIDYTAGVSRSSSTLDAGGITALVLAASTLLLGVATLVAVVGRRPSTAGEDSVAAPARPAAPAPEPSRRTSGSPADAATEYKIPPLPR